MRRRSIVHRFLFPCIAALVAVPLAIACGEDSVSIPDPERPESSTGDDSGNATSETGGGDGGADVVVTCADVVPDDTMGIYVTPTGTNSGTCGTRAAPCKTISHSVTRAGAALRTKVYAARGTYSEKATLAAGVEVIGGWDVTSGTMWKRACVSPESAVVIKAPMGQNITVEARDLGGEARLSTLSIESKPQGQVNAGESLYGIVAVGATTTLVLTSVNVSIGNGGDGANGAKGAVGADGGVSCPAGTGAAGTPGTQGTGAPAGAFDPTNEYTPGIAAAGNAATGGGDGTPAGGAGTCVTCGTCGVPPLCDFIPAAGPQACGKDGTAGCGGGPGAPGGPAVGGGSSVAVFAWDANVTINGGKIRSGDGGNGGAGGAGGAGGFGTKGAAGASTDLCTTACTFNGVAACTETKARGVGGTAGGNGAVGGLGGAGGGGGGGSSFAIYQGGAGVVTTGNDANLGHGKAGKGGGPAPNVGVAGAAADRVP